MRHGEFLPVDGSRSIEYENWWIVNDQSAGKFSGAFELVGVTTNCDKKNFFRSGGTFPLEKRLAG